MVFREILVPVDFSVNTEIAIKKAIEMQDAENPVINLMHVITPFSEYKKIVRLVYKSIVSNEDELFRTEKYKMHQLRRQISEKLPVGGKVETAIMKGSVEHCIVQHAKTLKCELIILGKHNRQRLFPFFSQVSPNKIARLSNCAVLMAKSGSMGEKLRSIVVPVGTTVPRRKIEMLAALSDKFHAKVYLVTLKTSQGIIPNECSHALLQTYRILKGLKHAISLEHKVIEGNNMANASLNYAQFILADMLLVSPDSETLVSSVTGRHITDLLITNSRLQVLEVEP